ncbi:MAG: hypothetical protein CL763_09115 [Chloroflexi bacterium]|nr:hypothetical protein [Chloroflexota bacterium]
MFKGKKILITGGTGSLGQALTKKLLSMDVDTIRIFSRNESKQVEMESQFNDDRLRFLLGDIRDLRRLNKAFEDIDIVFHTAALKHVPKIEYNPFEGIETNVIGSQNVIDASLSNNIEKSICVGTDKAVYPSNTYGATKLLMEKLFVTAQNHMNLEKTRTRFVALRYGNVLGSSGSVLPKFIEMIKNKKSIPITHESMTRYTLTMDEALNFILTSSEMAFGSEVFVPKLKSYNILDLKNALTDILDTNVDEQIIGIREGEKLHELLLNPDELYRTWDYEGRYIIEPFDISNNSKIEKNYPGIKKLNDDSTLYSSESAERLSVSELKKIIVNSGLINLEN